MDSSAVDLLPESQRRCVLLFLCLSSVIDLSQAAATARGGAPPIEAGTKRGAGGPPPSKAAAAGEGVPPTLPCARQSLADFVNAAATAVANARRFRLDVDRCLQKQLQRRKSGLLLCRSCSLRKQVQQQQQQQQKQSSEASSAVGSSLASLLQGEPLHVFAASAFASLHEASEKLMWAVCPHPVNEDGAPPDACSTPLVSHSLPVVEALLGCLTALLLLLNRELLPTHCTCKKQQQQQHQQQQQQEQEQHQQSPLARGWFFGCLFGLCMHMGSRALDLCMRFWPHQPQSASLSAAAIAAMQLLAVAATAAWPLQYEAHRLRSAPTAQPLGSPVDAPLEASKRPLQAEMTGRSSGEDPSLCSQTDGVFRRCFAAPVPASGGLPTGAICGIAAHELLLLLQLISSSSSRSNSSLERGSGELAVWALRCLYTTATCFGSRTDEGEEGAFAFNREDAAAARDAALRLYPLIGATLFGMLTGRSSSGNSNNNSSSSSSYAGRQLPRKVACAAALALREWMRSALKPLPLKHALPAAAAAAVETAASDQLLALKALMRDGRFKGECCGRREREAEPTDARRDGKSKATQAAAVADSSSQEDSREGAASRPLEDNEEVNTQNALQVLLTPASQETRRRALEETATRAQALWEAPLALSGCWSRRFCRALLAAEWLCLRTSCSQGAAVSAGATAAATTTAAGAAAATGGALRKALTVLIEGLVDEDPRVRRFSEYWLSLASAGKSRTTAATAAAATAPGAKAVEPWAVEAAAFLNTVLKGSTPTADQGLLDSCQNDAAAAACERAALRYRLLPLCSDGEAPLTPLEALELLGGEDTFQSALLQAAEAAAACSCCLAPTGAGQEEARSERLLAALRRLRGHAKLCILMQEQQQDGDGRAQGALGVTAADGRCSSSACGSNNSSSNSESCADIRGQLILNTSLDVFSAAAAFRRLCRLRPCSSSSSSSSRCCEQPSAILFSPQTGASDSALQAEPIITQLDPPHLRERGFVASSASATTTAPEAVPSTAAAPAPAATAAWGSSSSSSRSSANTTMSEHFEGMQLAVSAGSAAFTSNVLLSVRQAVHCLPPLLRGELLLLLLESSGLSSGGLALILRRAEGLVVVGEALTACLSLQIEAKTCCAPQQQLLLEAWQVDAVLLALLQMHQQLQLQQRDYASPLSAHQQQQQQKQQQQQQQTRDEEGAASSEGDASSSSSASACSCFYCADEGSALSGPLMDCASSAAEVSEGLSVGLEALLWSCVSRCVNLLAMLRGPKALAPHLPRMLVLLFEALGSPNPTLSAAAASALEVLHDATGSCPMKQQRQQQQQQVAGGGEEGGEGEAAAGVDKGTGSDDRSCGECLSTAAAEAAAAAAETGVAAASCEGSGARCLLLTEGNLLLDELVCRMQELPIAAFGAGDDPKAVCLLSSVIALAPPSLLGAFGALLTTLLQQQQQWVLQQQQQWALQQQQQQFVQHRLQGLDPRAEGSQLLLPPAMPLWLLRVMAVHGFVLSSRVLRSRRAAYASKWGPLLCCSCSSSASISQGLKGVPCSLPRRRVCRLGHWAPPVGIDRSQHDEGGSSSSFSDFPRGSEALSTLREAALLECDEDGYLLDAPEAIADESERTEPARFRASRFGALRLQATQMLLRVRHHLADRRPLAAAYAHLATLRCLFVLSTRERELLPRIHEQAAPLRVFVFALGILKLLVATAGNFIRDRFAKDVAAALPARLCCLPPSESVDAERRSESYKAEVAVVSTLAFCAIVMPDLFFRQSALEAALFCCMRCMHLGAPSIVLKRAARALVALHAVNPARVWFKCTRAIVLARHLQKQKAAEKVCSLKDLPKHVADVLTVLSHGTPSWDTGESSGVSRRAACEGSTAARHWVDACIILDVACVEELRPLLEERLAAAKTITEEAAAKCLRDYAEARLLLWGGTNQGGKATECS
ncbi:hypothetical protein Emag_004881 [Eimeria magna]